MEEFSKDMYTEPVPDEQDTVLIIPGQTKTFHHTDRNMLRKIGEPVPNPTAQAAATKAGRSRS